MDSFSQAHHAECILAHMKLSNFTTKKSLFRIFVNANIGSILVFMSNLTDLESLLEPFAEKLGLIYTPLETATAMQVAWSEGKHSFD